MKKSLIFVGILAIGYANAQTENYEGRVGINTTEPSATLNVKSLMGKDQTTKNVELTNSLGHKLITVLDNGNVGIGARNNTEEVALEDIAVTDDTTGNSADTHRFNRLNIVFPGEKRSILFQGNSTRVGEFNKNERMSSRMRYTWLEETADLGMIRGASAWIAGLAINFNDVEKIRFHKDGRIGINTSAPTHTLHIKPENTGTEPLKIEGLKESTGTMDKVLVADANGVVKIRAAVSTKASEVASTTAMECNADNRGKMNFVQGEDGKSDVFGICMKNKNGNYYWGYMVGGNNPTNGTGAFGSGL